VGTMDAARLALFAVAGLLFGSFLTVVVYRTPRGLSVVAPRSACPGCGQTVRARDNVPVLSYLMLGGKCRGCRSPISAEYPIVEALTAALFVGAALRFRSPWAAGLVAPFLGLMVAVAVIDARHRIIPNRVTYPGLLIASVVIVVAALAGGGMSIVGAALGMLAFGGSLLLVALIAPHGMGMGDVKLTALIGLVLGSLGLRYVAVAAIAGVLAGGLGGVAALLLGRSRKDAIPFGPYLAGGAVVATFVAPQVATWYTGLLGA